MLTFDDVVRRATVAEAIAATLAQTLRDHKYHFESESPDDTGWDVCSGCGQVSWRDCRSDCPITAALAKYDSWKGKGAE